MKSKPDCYKCVHRDGLPGDAHSRCNNHKAIVTGDKHGIEKGWFFHPINYDPVWLLTCNGYSEDEADKLPKAKPDPLLELLIMLRQHGSI